MHHGFSQYSCTYYIDCWVCKVDYINQFICVKLSLIISTGPANCYNHFLNKILSVYSRHPIRNYGIYLVREMFFLRKYELWRFTHQIQIQLVMSITILKRVCGIYYPFKLFRRKRVYFVVNFGRLPYQLDLEFKWPGEPMKNIPQNIRMIVETKKRWVQNPSGGFFTSK